MIATGGFTRPRSGEAAEAVGVNCASRPGIAGAQAPSASGAAAMKKRVVSLARTNAPPLSLSTPAHRPTGMRA
ncbi:hypothetical protein C7S17_1459 [Burkholderia thailandensis]|nr:hypothetical protein [Burkholderia thailandensis]